MMIKSPPKFHCTSFSLVTTPTTEYGQFRVFIWEHICKQKCKKWSCKLNKLYHNVHCFAHYAAIAHLHAAAEDVTLHSILFL